MHYDKKLETWFEYHELKNKQVCGIAFQKEETQKTIYWNVVFAVGNKQSHVKGYLLDDDIGNITCRSTGNCGLEALFWAKDKIIEFEDIPLKSYLKKNKIMVNGEDKRRFRAYEKGLKRYGYKKERHPLWGWVLIKNI